MSADLEAAYKRMSGRMRAGATEREPAAGLVRIGGTAPAPIMAGTDLPAQAVLQALEHLVDMQVRGMLERGAIGNADLHGLALAAFLFGWESRA